MKPLLVATAVVLCLAACAPAPPPPGDSPVVVITERPVGPVETATEEPVDPDALPADAYLRLRATAHLRSGGTLDLVMTAYEPTIEAETAASTIDAISDGCTWYSGDRSVLAGEPGVELYYSRSELVISGDAVVPNEVLAAEGVGTSGAGETGSGVFAGSGDCVSSVRAAGTATLYNYFSTYGFADLQDALHWQYTGFYDVEGTEALNVTFDNCSVEYSDHARTIMGGDIDWKLREEAWRCVVGPFEFE